MKRIQWMRASASTQALAAALISACLASTNAAAQEETSEAPASAGAEREVIVVMARKREEAITDVPVAISTLSQADADNLVLDSVADYIRQTPGAILIASGPAYLHDIALRGQGGGRLGFSESTTGIYRDGIYIAGGGFGGRTFSTMDFFDMRTLEVYRGPQGALYGRNAVGGAANLITNRPEDIFGVRARLRYDDLDTIGFQTIVNAPLVGDQLLARIGGYVSEQNDGHHHLASTGEALDVARDWGVRGSLAWRVGPDTDARFTIERSYSEAPGFASLGQNVALDPDPYTHVGLDRVDVVTIDQTSVFAEFTHGFGFGDLTVLGNYRDRDGDRENGDLDHFFGFNVPILNLLDEQFEDFERYGGEIRLASNDESRFTWLIGADFQTYTSDVVTERTGTFAGPFALSAPLRNQLRRDVSTEELFSYSAFALAGFDLTERLNFTIEARVQHDEKDLVFERIDLDAFTDNTVPPVSFDQSSTRFLPTATLLYALGDDNNIYARIASGYRPGGFNPQPAPGFFDRTPYDPETAYSFELGWKSVREFRDVTLETELALFWSLTEDIQTTASLTNFATVPALQNVGDATIYGAEFTARAFTPFAGGDLSVNLGLSFSNGEFQENTLVIFNGVTYDLDGARAPRTRDYIVNLATTYSYPLATTFDIFGALSFQAEGGGYDNAIGNLNIAESRSSESFEMFDLRLGVSSENWRLSAFGRNITDEVYRTVSLNGNDYHNDGRVIGLELDTQF